MCGLVALLTFTFNAIAARDLLGQTTSDCSFAADIVKEAERTREHLIELETHLEQLMANRDADDQDSIQTIRSQHAHHTRRLQSLESTLQEVRLEENRRRTINFKYN